MFVLLCIDNDNVSLYTIGEFAKTYSSIKEVEEEIEKLEEIEKNIFGDNSIEYLPVWW